MKTNSKNEENLKLCTWRHHLGLTQSCKEVYNKNTFYRIYDARLTLYKQNMYIEVYDRIHMNEYHILSDNSQVSCNPITLVL